MTPPIERAPDGKSAPDDLDVFVPVLPPSPYPGLRPFVKSEWPIFFGRERIVDEIVEDLLQGQLIVVHGPSGNGKSSLVQAGVQAKLEQQHARSRLRWRTCVARPGTSPLMNLSDSLAHLFGGGSDSTRVDFRRALNHGRQSPATLAKLLALDESDRLCIILDQFEEVFRFDGEAHRDQSILLTDFLVGFHARPPSQIYVLVTMRSEFLGECARFHGLAETINGTQYLLPRMDTNGLLRAVREPAALYGGVVTEALAERLVAEATGGQDELPLMQHGLSRLWRTLVDSPEGSAAKRILDLPDYVAHGPLGRLLSDHADSVASHDDTTETWRIIEELFRALTDINADGVAIRRPQQLAELIAAIGTTEDRLLPILDAFRAPGVSFVTPYPPAAINLSTTVDISHEALIRRWRRISDPQHGWLQREFRDGLIWRSLVAQAEMFAENPKNLLSEATTEARGAWLAQRTESWARRYGGQWAAIGALIGASRREVEHQRQKEKEDRDRAEALRKALGRAALRRRLAWAAGVVAVGMMGLTGLVYEQWQRAEDATQLAAQRQAEAESSREEAISSLAAEQKANRDLKDALQRATEAQNASGTVFAETLSSLGSDKQVTARLLRALRGTTDPYQVAVLGQSVAAVAKRATSEELKEALLSLAKTLGKITDPGPAAAIVQALRAIGQALPNEAAQAIVQALLAQMAVAAPNELAGLAIAVGAMGPKLTQRQQAAATQVLVGALNRGSNSYSTSAIVKALADLDWTPGNSDARSVEPLLSAVKGTTDPDQLTPLLNAIEKVVGVEIADDPISRRASDSLLLTLRNTRDPYAASAIAQTIVNLGTDIRPTAVKTVVEPLLVTLRSMRDAERIRSLLDGIVRILPSADQKQATSLTGAVFQAVQDTDEPLAIADAVNALVELGWKPTTTEAQRALERILASLGSTDDPDEIERLATAAAKLSPSLGRTKSDDAAQGLFQVFQRSQDRVARSEIAKAIAQIDWKPTNEQARMLVGPLASSARLATDTSELRGVLNTIVKLAPSVERKGLDDAIQTLSQTLRDRKDPKEVAEIAKALSRLNWTPTTQDADAAMVGLIDAVESANDPDDLAELGRAIKVLAPKLSPSATQNALSRLRKSMTTTDQKKARSLSAAVDALVSAAGNSKRR